jgi:hypothetical protein
MNLERRGILYIWGSCAISSRGGHEPLSDDASRNRSGGTGHPRRGVSSPWPAPPAARSVRPVRERATNSLRNQELGDSNPRKVCQPVPTGAANRARRGRPKCGNRVRTSAMVRDGRRVPPGRTSREPTASPGFPPLHRALRALFPERVSRTERNQSRAFAPSVKPPEGEFRRFGTIPNPPSLHVWKPAMARMFRQSIQYPVIHEISDCQEIP